MLNEELPKELPWEERTEQWKTDGECLKCRRHGWCQKQCKKNREAMYAELRRMLMKKGIPTPEQIEGGI